jgi:homoserine O-succinyltransferase
MIGLVNNMPDAALRTTERQFRELLAAASRNFTVALRLFSLPEIPRAYLGRSYLRQHYDDIGELWANDLDGLIVTGTVPRARVLADEPYWRTLTRLVDWAEDHTVSTIWSCLAAHSAVLHTDGIARYAVGEKLSGVFECVKVAYHPIVAGAPPRWCIPHSRYNEVPETALVSKGYRTLSRSKEAGADVFIIQRKSLFVFMQGHPEYDAGALFREYRRDVGEFLSGERDIYPEMPRCYFDATTTAAFEAFRERALRCRDLALFSSFPSMSEGKLAHSWQETAVSLYANWLSYLMERRTQDLQPARLRISAPRSGERIDREQRKQWRCL